MFVDNNATRIKRSLLIDIAKLFFEDELFEKIDYLPIEHFPKDEKALRCCIYKDRAITKFRLMSNLGICVEHEEDELTRLSEYAEKAFQRNGVSDKILTVMQEACKSCVKANYTVTNACQGCVARPCTVVCPRNAITVTNGRAFIEPSKCVSCGKCMTVCPYHAIIFIPVPCEESCPVGAIYRDENGKENIDFDKCIYCGKCTRACPFGAILEVSQIIDILKAIKEGKKVAALLAPAVAGQFPGNFKQLATALKKIGFTYVVEVAAGAEITAKKETEEFIERMEKGDPFMTTSCCPAYTEAVKKHIPSLAKYVSDTPTPLHFTAEITKKEYSDDVVNVFIGPCIAKRHEGHEDKLIDYVMTFEELGAMFVGKGIDTDTLEESEFDITAGRSGRVFPLSGGVTTAISEALPENIELKPVVINGITKKEMKLLPIYAKGRLQGNFMEVMSCEGGCIAGPGVLTNPKLAAKKATDLAK